MTLEKDAVTWFDGVDVRAPDAARTLLERIQESASLTLEVRP